MRDGPVCFTLWSAAALLAIAHVLAFDFIIATAEDVLQVGYTPDDAYYYLVLAKNFATSGTWTFDSGSSVTSGFHLLHAYLLSGLHSTTGFEGGEFVRAGLVLGSLTTLAVTLVAWAVGFRLRDPIYMALLALLIGTSNFAYNSASLVEWPLALLFSSLYWIQFWRCSDSGGAVASRASLCLLGFAGSLSRSDFGLLPLALLAASLVPLPQRRPRAVAAAASFGLLGAASGAVLGLVHNYVVSGDLLQSSARVKAYWAEIHGSDLPGAAALLKQALGIEDLGNAYLLALVLAAAVLLFALALRRRRSERSFEPKCTAHESTVLIGAFLCIAGYVLFYSNNADIQPWYTGNLIAPLFAMLYVASTWAGRISGKRAITAGISLLSLAVIAANLVRIHPVDAEHSPWPYQAMMLHMGKYLAQHELDAPVGSWNAGIIGFYQGGEVINLDGLVNNDVYPYVISNRLPAYIEANGIGYIADFRNMLLYEDDRFCRGFDDPAFIERLVPLIYFDDEASNWRFMTLFRIAPERN